MKILSDMCRFPHHRRQSPILHSAHLTCFSHFQEASGRSIQRSTRQKYPDETYMHFTAGVRGFDVFHVRLCSQVSRWALAQHLQQSREDTKNREHHSAQKKGPQRALALSLQSSTKAFRLRLLNTLCQGC